MKNLGIVRQIDEVGRIVLPIELRNALDIQPKDSIEIIAEEGRIILKKYAPACVFCGSTERTSEFKSKIVCDKCRKELSKSKK